MEHETLLNIAALIYCHKQITPEAAIDEAKELFMAFLNDEDDTSKLVLMNGGHDAN